MKTRELLHELKHHIPFTLAATVIALAAAIIVNYSFQGLSEGTFEVLHPLHVLASAMVTAGIFHRYKKKIIPGLLVGVAGSIIVGSLSDVILPWLGGTVLNLGTSFHLPLIETPIIILAAAILGSFLGMSTEMTRFPHLVHVALSVFASLFYLFAFSSTLNPVFFIWAFGITFVAVIIPCCISDILFPFFFLGEKIKHCDC